MDVLRVGLGGNEQDPPRGAAANQAVGQGQPVHETRTSQVEIQGPDRGPQFQPVLHQAGGGGQGIVGRLRAKQEKIDRLRSMPAVGRAFRRPRRPGPQRSRQGRRRAGHGCPSSGRSSPCPTWETGDWSSSLSSTVSGRWKAMGPIGAYFCIIDPHLANPAATRHNW